MNRLPLILAFALLAAGLGATENQTANQLDKLLASAQHQETAEGDLRAAIETYKRVVAQAGPNRAMTATALLGMAGCYDKLGSAEARPIYEQIVGEYTDQPTAVVAARTRLAAMASAGPTPAEAQGSQDTLHAEMLWATAENVSPQGSVSPDGRLMTYVDWGDMGNLAIHNFETGENRRLTHSADNGAGTEGGGYADDSRVSPNGDMVAYSWARDSPAGETGDLRLVRVDGEDESRVVWTPPDGSWAGIQDWFPSGDRVVVVVSGSYDSPGSQRIVIVATGDGAVQQVRSTEWGAGGITVRVSPDGRYLAYSRPATTEAPARDIFVLAVDGSSESVVVRHAADDGLVAWGPGGSHLLFNSDRGGASGLWAQRMQDATPVEEPQLLVPNLDVHSGLGMTRDGTLHYVTEVSRQRMKLAELDLTTGDVLSQPRDLTDRFVGNNLGGRFSPNGDTLAYVSQRKGVPGQAIVLKSVRTGEERDLPHGLQRILVGTPHWRPDGAELIVRGRDGQGRTNQWAVDVQTGDTRPLTDVRNPSMYEPQFTPDGKTILYRDLSPDTKDEHLWSYRVSDGIVQPLTALPGGRSSLSPDGRWIARSQRNAIRLYPAIGGDGVVLATTTAEERFASWATWTPDATALAVLKQDPTAGAGLWRLWMVPVDGSSPVATQLVYEPTNLSNPLDIHPDGRRVVFAAGGGEDQFWALHNLRLD